jgi:DNA-binding GntR family transcriptional regulator
MIAKTAIGASGISTNRAMGGREMGGREAAGFEPIEVRTLADRVYDVVRDRILAGDLAGGDPIRQDTIAAELGISKIPLREALTRLEQHGLVSSSANRGFVVAPLSAEEAEEVFALRLKLEPDAILRGCRRAGRADHAVARAARARCAPAASTRAPTTGSSTWR